MLNEFYLINIYINMSNHFCFYYYKDEEFDQVMCFDNKILYFDTEVKARSFAEGNNMVISENDTAIYDFDNLKISKDFDCKDVIEYWNLFDTISNSLNMKFIGKNRKYYHTYKKLFGGCNTAMNLYEYHPVWTNKDIKDIQKVLKQGQTLLVW